MKNILAIVSVAMTLAACGTSEKEYDATGTFEATETTVSAEQGGRLLTFDVKEGDPVETGREVGLIDTTDTWLKILQLQATKAVYQSQKPDIKKQIAALRQQLAKAQAEQRRYQELVSDGAAPSQVSALSTNTQALNRQMNATEAQISQLREQLKKCRIVAPQSGSVLEKYVERGEFVAIGKPLFKMADMEEMYLRAYVTSAQLQDIKVGQQVKVFADYGGGQKKTYPGTVSWISGRSEFTPKTILTDDERADLVYAMKIRVKNDGYIKIGMYGEVKF